MAAAKLNGRFLSDKQENFEEYLKEMGFGYFARKAAVNMSSTIEIKNQGNKWVCSQETIFITFSLEFELDKEFEETTADGRKFMTLVTLTPDGKLIQRQRKIKDSDKATTITRYIEDDDVLVVIIQSGAVTAKRTYNRVK